MVIPRRDAKQAYVFRLHTLLSSPSWCMHSGTGASIHLSSLKSTKTSTRTSLLSVVCRPSPSLFPLRLHSPAFPPSRNHVALHGPNILQFIFIPHDIHTPHNKTKKWQRTEHMHKLHSYQTVDSVVPSFPLFLSAVYVGFCGDDGMQRGRRYRRHSPNTKFRAYKSDSGRDQNSYNQKFNLKYLKIRTRALRKLMYIMSV